MNKGTVEAPREPTAMHYGQWPAAVVFTLILWQVIGWLRRNPLKRGQSWVLVYPIRHYRFEYGLAGFRYGLRPEELGDDRCGKRYRLMREKFRGSELGSGIKRIFCYHVLSKTNEEIMRFSALPISPQSGFGHYAIWS